MCNFSLQVRVLKTNAECRADCGQSLEDFDKFTSLQLDTQRHVTSIGEAKHMLAAASQVFRFPSLHLVGWEHIFRTVFLRQGNVRHSEMDFGAEEVDIYSKKALFSPSGSHDLVEEHLEE